MVKEYTPNRGDIVVFDFNPQAGKEQAKRRPALVLSPKAYNAKVGLAIMCPITSKKKGYPFEVDIPPNELIEGVVLSDQVKSLDWRVRRASFACKAPEGVVATTLAKLDTLLR